MVAILCLGRLFFLLVDVFFWLFERPKAAKMLRLRLLVFLLLSALRNPRGSEEEWSVMEDWLSFSDEVGLRECVLPTDLFGLGFFFDTSMASIISLENSPTFLRSTPSTLSAISFW